MNGPTLPPDYSTAIPTLADAIRRAIDGTVPPLFVDYTNKRVLIGSTTASGTATLQVFGNIAVIASGSGYVFADGTKQTTAASTGASGSPASVNPYYAWLVFGGF